MSAVEPILLTAYLLSIVYLVFKILDSFNDEYAINLDTKSLDEVLGHKMIGESKLSDMIGIGFKFDKRYEFDSKFNQLAITINNKSADHSIYVDWDYCTLTDLGGKARRVTRVPPGLTLDLLQAQVFSTIAPKTALKENITAEDMLQRKKDKEEYEIQDKSIIDIKADKGKLGKFTKRLIELEVFLELVFRIVGPNRVLGGDRIHVPCKFVLTKYPWYVGLPWNPR